VFFFFFFWGTITFFEDPLKASTREMQ